MYFILFSMLVNYTQSISFMIRINQPGLKSFVFYVFGFIFLTLFIYLGIPFFFDYKNNQSDLEKKDI